MYNGSRNDIRLIPLLKRRPDAAAGIDGGASFPGITGIVQFYETGAGVIVYAEIEGLPTDPAACGGRIFGFHIHEGTFCGGDMSDPFSDAMGHYNPSGCPHPYHAGDLPPLFGNDGFALELFLTDRFTTSEVIGRAVIIHDRPDDFTTQPSGNSGTKIACGIIRPTARGR